MVRSEPTSTQYGGRGVCYVEFGDDRVATVDVTFEPGRVPTGGLQGPSRALAADKAEFGASRIGRWFGRTCGST
jgi:sulfide:quinone oxidoreductase